MSAFRLPKYAVLDGALPSVLAEDVLAFAIANQDRFHPAQVYGSNLEQVEDRDFRVSEKCSLGLGELKQPVRAAMLDRFEELCALTGVKPFPVKYMELELVAHRDGGFFATHIDTVTGGPEAVEPMRRILSSVCYLNKRPRVYTGGEIRIRGFGASEGALVEPRHNRLVAFPSMAPHEVLPTHVPGDAFSDARFSINCWFHDRRAKN